MTRRAKRYAIGLLSGTSCDGIDAACCRIDGRATPEDPFAYDVEILAYHEAPYSDAFRRNLLAVCDRDTGRVDELARLHVELGHAFAEAADTARDAAGLDPAEIAVVGSHGHTAWHDPESIPLSTHADSTRATLQIGDPSPIAERTSIRTVADFRSRDVAVGGHGAPLAPFVDAAAFGSETETRAIQNIGGIGNSTILEPSADRSDIVAFDTGPGNMVIDAVVALETDGDRTYDVDGQLAARGTVDETLVESFLDDSYFHRSPPKTTGREYFGREFAEAFIAAGSGLATPDLVASATMLTARSIARAYDRFVDPYPDETIVSGGGAANPTLCAMLADELACPVSTLDQHGMDPARKEGALFATLAIATIDGVPGNVPSATGASRPAVLGSVTPAPDPTP